VVRKRRRLIALAVAASLAVVSWVFAATACAEASVPSPSSTSASTAVRIYPSLALVSADVRTVGSTARRRFGAYHTAVFVQSWIGAATSGRVRHAPLSAGVSVYRVDVTGTWNGGADVSTRTVFYASDGRRAWIALPPSTDTPLSALAWWIAPTRVIAAFAGTVKLVPTLGTDAVSSTTTIAPARPGGASHSAGGWIAAAVGVLAVVALVGAGVWRRRRGRRDH
jgi:cobalamin biosynthesis Mg chelatase CobN